MINPSQFPCPPICPNEGWTQGVEGSKRLLLPWLSSCVHVSREKGDRGTHVKIGMEIWECKWVCVRESDTVWVQVCAQKRGLDCILMALGSQQGWSRAVI